MKKQILTLVLGLFLLVSVSSLTIHGGETYYEDLTDDISNLQSFECNLTAQTYDLNGTNFTTNSTGWILSLADNFKKDNLTISCLLNGWKEVSIPHGSSRRYVEDCSEWSKCINGSQTANCNDGKMIKSRSCEVAINQTKNTTTKVTLNDTDIPPIPEEKDKTVGLIILGVIFLGGSFFIIKELVKLLKENKKIIKEKERILKEQSL